MNRLTQKKQKARHFARAFLHVYAMSEQELFAGIDALLECCRQYPLAFYTLALSSASPACKEEAVKELARRFLVPAPLADLINAMLHRKELSLLEHVLLMAKEEYKKNNDIYDVKVMSSHPLTDEQKAAIKKEVSAILSGTLRFSYGLDSKLIAGFSVETPLYYWQHSVARTLCSVQQQLLQEHS